MGLGGWGCLIRVFGKEVVYTVRYVCTVAEHDRVFCMAGRNGITLITGGGGVAIPE